MKFFIHCDLISDMSYVDSLKDGALASKTDI